jgi:hypothetical protein
MATYYVFAIGGTGARCLESFIFLCAMGLGPENVHADLSTRTGIMAI